MKPRSIIHTYRISKSIWVNLLSPSFSYYLSSYVFIQHSAHSCNIILKNVFDATNHTYSQEAFPHCSLSHFILFTAVHTNSDLQCKAHPRLHICITIVQKTFALILLSPLSSHLQCFNVSSYNISNLVIQNVTNTNIWNVPLFTNKYFINSHFSHIRCKTRPPGQCHCIYSALHKINFFILHISPYLCINVIWNEQFCLGNWSFKIHAKIV